MTVDELRREVSIHLQDPARVLVNDQQVLKFLNSAGRDAANEEWYIDLEDDESIDIVVDQFQYEVPDDFVYIHEILKETTVGSGVYEIIPWNRWRIVVNDTLPQIDFSTDFFEPDATYNIKIRGQRRPTSDYTDEADVLDVGMESFLRERVVAYSARYLARSTSGRSRTYDALLEEAWNGSEGLLQRQSDLFSKKEYSRVVPGR